MASVDVLLSRSSGATFDEVLASGIADSGSFVWQVPDVLSAQARVRVVVRDAQGRTGSDDSDADFAILGVSCAAAATSYGVGFGAGGTVPALTTATLPRLGTNWLANLASGRANQPVAFALGARPLAVELPGGGTLWVEPAMTFVTNGDGAGNASLPVAIPAAANLCGAAVFWQGVTLDGALSAGLATRLGS